MKCKIIATMSVQNSMLSHIEKRLDDVGWYYIVEGDGIMSGKSTITIFEEARQTGLFEEPESENDNTGNDNNQPTAGSNMMTIQPDRYVLLLCAFESMNKILDLIISDEQMKKFYYECLTDEDDIDHYRSGKINQTKMMELSADILKKKMFDLLGKLSAEKNNLSLFCNNIIVDERTSPIVDAYLESENRLSGRATNDVPPDEKVRLISRDWIDFQTFYHYMMNAILPTPESE